jgi:hypothetical protein
MDITEIARSTQEQAVAAWIDPLNPLRVDELTPYYDQFVAYLQNILK